MILMKDDLGREWQWLFLRCKNTAACGTTATLDRT